MKSYRNEQWKLFEKENYNVEKEKIYISNYGRVKKEISEDEYKLVKIGQINNFETFSYPKLDSKRRNSAYVHRVVALLFLNKEEGQKFVIHINHNLKDNYYKNLKWVNQKELTAHQITNPKRIAKFGIKPGAKLTEAKVRVIKKKLLDPNRRTRLRIIASQFGITTTQLDRIKSGENWGEIEV
ncbi:HNH endonuclease [Polaribacter sp. Hel1_85]|uniref:HNH endonuclease n=1 Tax=Polaribacter sp. Hel1_85 TaxID=1250005 RepID=UPI00052C5BA6|nr:HNH endonuclease [Polaribacter sp. Hel1_85]KGL62480.1 phage related protein endodeoxyribonuclease [Polaribacter sp. Hel1_85]